MEINFQQIPSPSAFLQVFILQERHSQNPQAMMTKKPRNPKYITPIWPTSINTCITFIQLSFHVKVSRFLSFAFPFIICSMSVILTLDFAGQLSWISYYLGKLGCYSALSHDAFPELRTSHWLCLNFSALLLLHQSQFLCFCVRTQGFQLENGVTLWAHVGFGKLLKKPVGIPWKALSVIYLINKLISSL